MPRKPKSETEAVAEALEEDRLEKLVETLVDEQEASKSGDAEEAGQTAADESETEPVLADAEGSDVGLSEPAATEASSDGSGVAEAAAEAPKKTRVKRTKAAPEVIEEPAVEEVVAEVVVEDAPVDDELPSARRGFTQGGLTVWTS